MACPSPGQGASSDCRALYSRARHMTNAIQVSNTGVMPLHQTKILGGTGCSQTAFQVRV